MAGERYLTRDHDRIRNWAQERGGRPAAVKESGIGADPGILRLDFPGYSGEESLEQIGWDEWFEKFDASGLVLLYQETTSDGDPSNFNKLIRQETAAEASDGAAWADGERSGSRGGGRRLPQRRGTRRTRRSPSRSGA